MYKEQEIVKIMENLNAIRTASLDYLYKEYLEKIATVRRSVRSKLKDKIQEIILNAKVKLLIIYRPNTKNWSRISTKNIMLE